jgi:cell division initiation protein
MALTPVEIRHIRPPRSAFGYRRAGVEALLEQIADDFEVVWRDRADLTDKVEALETDLVRYKELENLLRATLVSAERAALEMKDQARREAELIVSEAHGAAREITRHAADDLERLGAEVRRVRGQLTVALATLDVSQDEIVVEAPEPESVREIEATVAQPALPTRRREQPPEDAEETLEEAGEPAEVSAA